MISKVKKISKKSYKGKTYDFCFDEDHLFYASCPESKMYIRVHNSAFPDIDLDVESGKREDIRKYLESKYGKDSVFGVVTYNLYLPKSALQDVSRGLGKDTSFMSTLMNEVSKLADLEHEKDLLTYFEKLSMSPNTSVTLQQWINENQDTIYWAQKLLGLTKNLGTHAGGLIITDGPIYDFIPVAKSKEIVTAFREADSSTKDLSELGLLKLDILGLKTLNVINDCIKDVKSDTGVDISKKVKYLDLEDQNLYKKFSQGHNVGIFQFESPMISNLVKTINPDCFEDVVAVNSINRPGPLENFGPVYGKWKRWTKENNIQELENIEHIRYPFEFMKEPLKETYGCLIYQEQFMLMVKAAAGFNMGEADSFRRAIGWDPNHPKYYTVKKYFDKLEEGMLNKGYSKEDVQTFIDYCNGFMGYSYVRAHGLCYAYIAMQCLFLKVYYPAYFYVNLLNSETQEKYQDIISDAIANGIQVLPPSITKSKNRFTVENGNIRTGFQAIKGLGEAAYDEIVNLEISKCTTIWEVLEKPLKKVNKGIFKSLLECGAFDEFNIERERIEILQSLLKETKIQTWFTRKSGALSIEKMPECLFQFPEPEVFRIAAEVKEQEIPWIKLIMGLVPYIKVKTLTEEQKDKRAEDILGYSLLLAEKLGSLLKLAEKYSELNLQSLTSRTSEVDLCYFYVLKCTVSKTKAGKSYLTLKITDNHITISAKCWEMIDIKEGKAYVSNFKKDDWGYSLTNLQFVTEIDL